MGHWKLGAAAVLLTLLAAVLALGYFWGRSTVSAGQTAVLASRAIPPQEEALTAPAEAEAKDAAETELAERVDVNHAGAEELETLPGIGPALAGRIVAYREAHGPFRTPAQLMEVDGIGEKKLEAILDQIVLGG